MDVIGARFADLPAATAARRAILASVAVPAADVAVRPLGTTRYDEPIEAYVLAGRFPSAAARRVVRLMRDHGGVVISRRTESPPHARPSVTGSKETSRLTRSPASRGLAIVRGRRRGPSALVRVRTARACRRSS